MGGGNSQPTQQTVTQTNIPDYAQPYFTNLLNRTEAVSNQAYQPYGGQQVAPLNTQQTNALSGVAALGPRQEYTYADSYNNAAANGALGLGQYQSGQIGSTYNPQATQMFAAPSTVQSTYNPSTFDSATAQQYMNPYQQNVIDIAKREAIRQNGIQNVASDAAAAQSGAFGGSRAALVNAENQRNLNQQLDDIQNQGMNQAYTNAQQQFNTEQQAQLAAGQQNLGAQEYNSGQQMAYGQAGLQNQQYNEGQRQNAAQMALQGQIANEQARQGAAGIQNQAYANVGNLANNYANIGNAAQQSDLNRLGAQLSAGDVYQQNQQQADTAAYDNFVNQRDYPQQMLNFYSGILRGVPVTANSDVTTYQNTNPLSQAAGLLTTGIGAYKLANS